VAYYLELDEATVAPYLLGLDLSPAGREALLRCLAQLAESADTFLRTPDWRLTPGSDCIKVEWVFRDPVTKVIHVLRLIINDAAAPFGVLRVVYAEDFPSPGPPPGDPPAAP
jgi:hypothetical protein